MVAITTTFTPPAVTNLSRASGDAFDADIQAWLAWHSVQRAEYTAFTTEMNAAVVDINTTVDIAVAGAVASATAASDSAAASAAAATLSESSAAASAGTAIAAPGTSATSTTSLLVSIASKSLTIQTGKALVVGMPVNISYTTTPTTYMHGTITSYNSGTGALVVNVTKIAGTASTYALWTVALVGNAGDNGVSGLTYISTTTTLVAGYTYEADSTTAGFTATMPATPAVGATISLQDPLGTWGLVGKAVTLARNGSSFVDQYGVPQAEDFILDVSNLAVTFIYTASGWRTI